MEENVMKLSTKDKNALLLKHVRAIHMVVAEKYTRSSQDFDDAVQEMYSVFLECMDRYDESSNASFLTFALATCRFALIDFHNRNGYHGINLSQRYVKGDCDGVKSAQFIQDDSYDVEDLTDMEAVIAEHEALSRIHERLQSSRKWREIYLYYTQEHFTKAGYLKNVVKKSQQYMSQMKQPLINELRNAVYGS
jgi:RNA polymerase sigma factor (sigma-70 family)